jgi:ketosteroid isomerase-like protein
MSDEQQIRDLIERWATAVHRGDMPAVLVDHAANIVMFDVPPPELGVRGPAAYRETWPGFFEWQASGAVFDIQSLEVTAGVDVAFAFALLRCGTAAEFDAYPEKLLRLTVGLRKVDGRWIVTHEHHSFADPTGSPEVAETEVREMFGQWSDRTAAKDVDGLMEHIAPDIVSYEADGQPSHVGIEDVRDVCRRGLAATAGPVEFDAPDLTVRVSGDLLVTWGLDRVVTGGVEHRSRGTRVLLRRDGVWQVIHQHLSELAPSGPERPTPA